MIWVVGVFAGLWSGASEFGVHPPQDCRVFLGFVGFWGACRGFRAVFGLLDAFRASRFYRVSGL